MRNNIKELGLHDLSDREFQMVSEWLIEYNAMPRELKQYLHLFIALLPRQKTAKTPINYIKGVCEGRWKLYYPKTVWYVALRLAEFEIEGSLNVHATDLMVATSLKGIETSRTAKNLIERESMSMPDLYTQWEKAIEHEKNVQRSSGLDEQAD